ncbi:MAG: hypothetical protein AAF970_16795 [Bacteroidota bacterium]
MRLFRPSTKKPGTMPGAVVFSGEVPTHHVRLALITYDADTFHERVVADL